MTGWGLSAVGGIADALVSPRSWLVALAAALLRGGIVVLILPVVVLPTTTGLAVLLGPVVASVVLGAPSAEAAGVAAGAILVAVVWLVVGGAIAAAADVWLVRWFGRQATDGVRPDRVRGRHDVARVFVARIVAGLPLVAVVMWATSRLVAAAYLQLTNPSDVAAPVVLRVIRQVPEAPLAIILAWLATEIVASLAVRRIVLSSTGAMAGLGWAAVTATRHPVGAVATVLATTTLTVLLVLPALVASASAWGGLRVALIDGADPVRAIGLAIAFVGLWFGALALLGVAAAMSSAIWTAEARRRLARSVEAPEVTPDVPAVPTETLHAA